MHAIATPAASLTLLVPASLLPGEGDDLELNLTPVEGAGTPADLFKFYESFSIPRSSKFYLKGETISFDGDLEAASTLQMMQLSADSQGKATQIEARPAMSYFDWSGVLAEVTAAIQSEQFLGTADEFARVFTEAVREASNIAALGFAGEAVPILTVSLDAEARAASVSFLGIWLADAKGLAYVRSELPPESWMESTGIGQRSCILIETSEVEGHGLKEAALSAAMLALVFGSSIAQAAPQENKSVLTSLFNRDSRPGEVLQVKTQKLVQDAPRIYRDILDNPNYSDLRVIVDIGAQRAYIVKDGLIAFETPISSGRTNRMTPRGTFTITEKIRSGKMSTIYHCPLPGWMRLGSSAIGMHEGQLPGHPASHGCIRMPLESALFIFDHVTVGTVVQVMDSWTPPTSTSESILANN